MSPQTASPTNPPAASFRREAVLLRVAIILLAGLLIYSPIFHGDWIIDDNLEVSQNAVLQGPAALWRIWHGDAGQDYLPVKTTFLWAIWRVAGADSTVFHLANILLHLVNALLLWRLLWRLGLRQAWLGGLLFTVHPVFVGSVAWISEIKNTLSLAVLLLGMLAWWRFEQRGRQRRDYGWALGLFAAALLCKSSVVMFPATILLYAWWQRGRITRGDLLASLPFFALALAVGILTIHRQDAPETSYTALPLGGLTLRLGLAGINISFYLGKLVWPTNLLPMYPRWQVEPPHAWEILPWIGLGAAAGWLWVKRATVWARGLLFGGGFFLLNAAPVLGLLNMSYMRIAWAADHLIYLPAIGIIALAAAGSGKLSDWLGEQNSGWALGAVTLGLGALGFASYQHAGVYTNLETLTLYTVRANPNAWSAEQLYSSWLFVRERFDTAAIHARAAERINPEEPNVQNSLAAVLEHEGHVEEAITHLREAIRLNDFWAFRANLARCLGKVQQWAEAEREYGRLLQEAPGSEIGAVDASTRAVFHCNHGACLYGLGRVDEAIAEFRAALAIDPNNTDAQDNLTAALKNRIRAQESPAPQPDSAL